jgi:hypothetical protein
MIKFNLRGTPFIIKKDLLDKFPDSYLAKLVSHDLDDKFNVDKIDDQIYIDRSPYKFDKIIDSMKNNEFNDIDLIEEYDFYGLDYDDIRKCYEIIKTLTKITMGIPQITNEFKIVNTYCLKNNIIVYIIPTFYDSPNLYYDYVPIKLVKYIVNMSNDILTKCTTDILDYNCIKLIDTRKFLNKVIAHDINNLFKYCGTNSVHYLKINGSNIIEFYKLLKLNYINLFEKLYIQFDTQGTFITQHSIEHFFKYI